VTLIAQLGTIAPGGDVFEDLGVPSISPEGDVVFGAETVGQDQRPRWDIYRANVGAPSNQRIGFKRHWVDWRLSPYRL
jgi:hypothetical protein